MQYELTTPCTAADLAPLKAKSPIPRSESGSSCFAAWLHEQGKARGLARFPERPRAFPIAGPARRLGFAGPRVLSVC